MEKLTLFELAKSDLPGVESHSPFCLKVHRTLKAAGLAYTSRHVEMPSELAAVNPAKQVPVLLVGEEPIADSTRILQRIVAMAPRARLADHPEAWLWEDYGDRALNGFLVASRWADDRNWPAVREAYFGEAPWFVRKLVAPRIRARVLASLVARDVTRSGMDALWTELRRVLDALEERAPLGGFWLGERLTVADLGLFAQLQSLRTPLTPWQGREIELRPRLTDWLDRVDEASRAPAVRSLRAA
jgi:glutathione S-transferase